MSQFYRKIGKRFFQRFATDDDFIQKKDIGNDSENIVVVADADRLAKAYCITELFDGEEIPLAVASASIQLLGADASLPGVFSSASKTPPSFIVIDRIYLSITGNATNPVLVEYNLDILGSFEQVGGFTTASTQRIFKHYGLQRITASDQTISVNENIGLNLKIPYTDVTPLGDQGLVQPAFPRVLSSLQISYFGIGFDNTKFNENNTSVYVYWHAEY